LSGARWVRFTCGGAPCLIRPEFVGAVEAEDSGGPDAPAVLMLRTGHLIKVDQSLTEAADLLGYSLKF